jgi:hypothetical protein
MLECVQFELEKKKRYIDLPFLELGIRLHNFHCRKEREKQVPAIIREYTHQYI